ncbi:amidohydrolase [Salinivirga cyanobacteriivorans]
MKNLITILIILISVSCNSLKEKVDLIVKNATIYTVDAGFSKATAMVVNNGEIVAVGDKTLLSEYEAKKELNLKGKYVYPGLIDAHCHFYGYSMNLRQIDLRGTQSFDAILEKLQLWNETHRATWILGRGWDQNDWPVKKFPTNEVLNKLFPEKPVFLRRVDGHAAIVNDKALAIAGIDANTKVDGGEIITENGKPTGILIDNALELVRQHIDAPQLSEKVKYINQGAQNCYAAGLTTVSDAGLFYDDINLIDSMQRANELKMQVYAMLSPTEKNFKQFMEHGVYRTKRMHVHSVKLYADGALGSRGACMIEPYSDDPDNYGLIITNPEKMEHIARRAFNHDYQVNTHAIGDSANRLVLDLYGKILSENNDRRWRIEHAQVVNPEDIHMFGKYDIIPAVNTTHATSDMYWAGERLGKERLKHAYAYKDLLQQNGWLCNGSDFPVEHIDPLYGFYAAVARQDFEGFPADGFQMENSLNRVEALKAMTIWAAKSIFEEDRKGSLEPGKQADFVVLDEDIMNIDFERIPKVKNLATFIQGENVFNADKVN